MRIERENLERLRDQQEDFDVKKARSQEDYERQRRRLLAEGRRAEAARLAETFAIEQRRNQEDFNRERRRTLRNNAEALGDQSTRVDNRLESIDARAAARGVSTGGAVAGDATPLPVGSSATAQAGQRLIQLVINGRVDMNGQQVGQLIYESGLRERIDSDLAVELSQVGITLPNTAQAGI